MSVSTPSKRVIIVFGTRPEAIKLFPVIHALKANPRCDVVCCVSAQHREMLDQVLQIAGIRPDIDLDLMQPDQSLDQLSQRLMIELGKAFDATKPDRIIVQGDTSTAMIGALAGYYRKIPVSHVEAGLRSYDIYQPWPEEVNRKIIGAIADQHFAPTETASNALLAERILPESIHIVGNTVIDALHATLARITADPSLASGLDEIAARMRGRNIIAVTTHRRENFGPAMEAIAHAIQDIAERPDIGIVFPVHPNPNVRRVMQGLLGDRDNVVITDPFDYPHFVRLLSISHLVLTDSGGVQEEAPALGKPVLVMRETTERPEGVEAGTARLIGSDRARIVSEVFTLLDDDAAYQRMARAHNPFGDGRSAARIAEIVINGR